MGEHEFMNQSSFESVGITNPKCRVEIQEIFNIEFYGFTIEDEISEEIYRDFYVEDDEYFIEQINNSEFPKPSYEYQFRIQALRIIFSAVKKHCRVNSAIN